MDHENDGHESGNIINKIRDSPIVDAIANMVLPKEVNDRYKERQLDERSRSDGRGRG
jgi:hypothetical protein